MTGWSTTTGSVAHTATSMSSSPAVAATSTTSAARVSPVPPLGAGPPGDRGRSVRGPAPGPRAGDRLCGTGRRGTWGQGTGGHPGADRPIGRPAPRKPGPIGAPTAGRVMRRRAGLPDAVAMLASSPWPCRPARERRPACRPSNSCCARGTPSPVLDRLLADYVRFHLVVVIGWRLRGRRFHWPGGCRYRRARRAGVPSDPALTHLATVASGVVVGVLLSLVVVANSSTTPTHDRLRRRRRCDGTAAPGQ